MVAIPVEKHWTVRALSERDAQGALDFLNQQRLLNAYLISRIIDEGMGPNVQMVEVAADGKPVCLASLTSNLVLAAHSSLDAQSRASAVALLSERIISRGIPVRAIISEVTLVDELWKHLQTALESPTVIRLRQPVYALTSSASLTELHQMRYAASRDLEVLVPACAAMHTEEVGIDPLSRDPVGYRQRVRELIARRRALVWTEKQRVVFKCEFSAVTPDAVQLMGVWTHPSFRRKGYARRGLEEVCGHILKQGKKVTLFVNDFNRAAIDLYESLGFVRIGENRALIW